VIVRPSVVFGADDAFFNKFAALARCLPALPLIGGGRTRFQPVYVGDVAEAVVAALDHGSEGQIYELGGPEVLDFREIYARLFAHTGQRRMLVSLPFPLAKVQAAFMSVLPAPPLTCDQVESLKADSVVSAGALQLGDLGVAATALASVLPAYLESYRPGGRFAGGGA
jgi:NADH dehydrogenase